MKILVAIANHGVKNESYVRRLIDTYRKFRCDVDIVILSNIEKDLGTDIEVQVGLPSRNPWSLPFAHRQLFFDRRNDYDLYIYSEDDTEITEAHVRSFLDASRYLPEDKIPGFLRYEKAPDGTVYYSTVHGHYHWDLKSTLKSGPYTFARYTNDHSACYILTQNQLKHCIASGGFMVEPHSGDYDMLCSAATDPYVHCGMEKVIPISHMEDFCLHHLPDKYLGEIGIEKFEIDCQVRKLIETAGQETRERTFIESLGYDDNVLKGKLYFEPEKPELIKAVPKDAKYILSVGCERGLTEKRLVENGYNVVGIPLDCVIAQSAALNGIETVSSDFKLALETLRKKKFDVIIFNNIIRHIDKSDEIIKNLKPLLNEGGKIIISFNNKHHISYIKNLITFNRKKITTHTAVATSIDRIRQIAQSADLNESNILVYENSSDARYAHISKYIKRLFARRYALVYQKSRKFSDNSDAYISAAE